MQTSLPGGLGMLGIMLNDQRWQNEASRGLGIPISWTQNAGTIDAYMKAQSAKAAQEAARAGAGLSTELYPGGPMSTNAKTQFEQLQQQGRLAELGMQGQQKQSELATQLQAELEKLKLQAALKQQAQESLWGRITPLIGQFGIGGGGGGGTSNLSNALSSADFNPIRLQAEEARRKAYSGGGSLRQRGTQLSSITGSELSAIAQALSGGRATATTATTNLQGQLIALLGQLANAQ